MDHATGARLRAAREEHGLTPGEVAAAIGIPPEAVTDVEQGDALRHYGPGLAAAWTWAVGRHLGVAIDHELATWQPPTEPAVGHDPLPGAGEPASHPHDPPAAEPPRGQEALGTAGEGVTAGEGGAADPAERADGLATGEGAEADEAGDLAFREPRIEPGWLADYDHDPLESFDPSSTDRSHRMPREDPWGDELTSPAHTPSEPDGGHDAPEPSPTGQWPQPADPWPSPGEAWTPPEDDLWGPGADTAAAPSPGDSGGDGTPRGATAPPWADAPPDAATPPDDREGTSDAFGGDDPFATMSLRAAEAAAAEPRGADTGEADAEPTPGDALAAAGEGHAGDQAPHEVGTPPPAGPGDGQRPDDTGELPAEDDTRVLAFTEGDEAAPLEAPSRLRAVGALLIALVVLVAAGVGVGALAAQLLDSPAESPAATGDDADDPDAAEEPGEPAEDDGTADEPDPADDDAFEEPGGDAASDEGLGGDPEAAADPADTTVQVLDGADDDGRYSAAQDALDGLGYQVIASGPAANDYDETTVFVTDGSADEAAALAEADDRFAHHQPNDVGLSDEVDLHVVVGGDWPEQGNG